MYIIIITSSAQKDIRRLDQSAKNRVTVAILALADDPRPAGCIKIKSEPGAWRIRVGEYRVAYIVDDRAKIVTIIRAGTRGGFYS